MYDGWFGRSGPWWLERRLYFHMVWFSSSASRQARILLYDMISLYSLLLTLTLNRLCSGRFSVSWRGLLTRSMILARLTKPSESGSRRKVRPIKSLLLTIALGSE